MRKLTLALSAAALALTGAAIAQTAAPAAQTPQAARTHGARPDMTRADAQARAEAMFARMDANKDGTLDQADRSARQAMGFDRMDTDRNGTISRAEYDATRAGGKEGCHSGNRMAGGKGHGGSGGMGHGGGHGKAGTADAARTPVTRQAFIDRALAMFDRADANRDGTVTQAERKAAHDTMRQQWQARKAPAQQG